MKVQLSIRDQSIKIIQFKDSELAIALCRARVDPCFMVHHHKVILIGTSGGVLNGHQFQSQILYLIRILLAVWSSSVD